MNEIELWILSRIYIDSVSGEIMALTKPSKSAAMSNYNYIVNLNRKNNEHINKITKSVK